MAKAPTTPPAAPSTATPPVDPAAPTTPPAARRFRCEIKGQVGKDFDAADESDAREQFVKFFGVTSVSDASPITITEHTADAPAEAEKGG